MNFIYDQEGGTCAGFAIANAIYKQLGIVPLYEEVYEYYLREFGDLDGVDPWKFLLRLRKIPLAGVVAVNPKKIYDYKIGLVPWHGKLREAILRRDSSCLLVVNIRDHGQKQKIPLDENYRYKRMEGPVRSYHLMLADELEGKEIKVENSWGDDWGDDGFFYLPFSDLEHAVARAYTVTFKKI